MRSHTQFLFLSLCATAIAIQFGGINISGFEWGCDSTGTCPLSSSVPPLASLGNADGIGQMQHFVSHDGLNIFRLPVSWQYLVGGVIGPLDPTRWGNYDLLVQGCLSTGASCIIDIHNYARWNNNIIGQGGPTNAQFADIWSQLATKYAADSNVIFGLMNEPHDLPSLSTWATTLQAAVTAIRAICPLNTILLPGEVYASAGAFVSSGSAASLIGITNPDGSTIGLVFDVHQYLDADFSGTSATCNTTAISNLSTLETWLTNNNRMALMTETGGGSTSSCYTDLCGELSHLAHHSTLYLGWIGWAAGSFSTSYNLSETPLGSANAGWTDQGIVTNCVAGKFPSG